MRNKELEVFLWLPEGSHTLTVSSTHQLEPQTGVGSMRFSGCVRARMCVCASAWAVSVSVRVHLWMYSAGSSAELIELFFLNSWELLGRGQMPLATRCVSSARLCARACVRHFACTLCVSRSRACVPAPPIGGGQSLCACVPKGENLRCYVRSAWHAGRWSVSGAFSGLQASLVGRLSH